MEWNIYEELKPLFYPNSVAVVGATETVGKYGFNTFFNLLSGGFKGKIYPVNNRVDKVLGFKAYKSVKDIPEDLDLVVVVVPALQVPVVIEDCVEKNVKACIVISAGFRETGDEGKKLEDEVVNIARRGGVRVVGPNCMGIFNTTVNLNVLMASIPLDFSSFKGKISFVSQSGNLGTNMVIWGLIRGIGFNKFVSSGNEADLTCEDFIEYFSCDPETKVIMAYVEGFKPNSRFPRLAKEVTRKKPLVILKTGATEAGAKAARSHVGAMAVRDEIVDALFKQTGVIRVHSVEEFFDTAVALANQPLPRGKRVGIVTTGGGWGVVCADTCGKLGLEVPSLSRETIEKIDGLLPSYWSKSNPVD
ncbi:MAG: CoA-binding protein, partial [Candidatus Bathyarchaeota archaeon]|nr:CoA-binding protein [Candidatus Bathyarchaeota archaeon]